MFTKNYFIMGTPHIGKTFWLKTFDNVIDNKIFMHKEPFKDLNVFLKFENNFSNNDNYFFYDENKLSIVGQKLALEMCKDESVFENISHIIKHPAVKAYVERINPIIFLCDDDDEIRAKFKFSTGIPIYPSCYIHYYNIFLRELVKEYDLEVHNIFKEDLWDDGGLFEEYSWIGDNDMFNEHLLNKCSCLDGF